MYFMTKLAIKISNKIAFYDMPKGHRYAQSPNSNIRRTGIIGEHGDSNGSRYGLGMVTMGGWHDGGSTSILLGYMMTSM